MPRRARSIQGGFVYHVLNRSNARIRLFDKDQDYLAFEQVMEQAYAREALRILAYCVMPNHWHMVVWPEQGADNQVSEFLRWLTLTHTQRWHAHHDTAGTGHLYQGRFKSFPIQSDKHLYTVLRYVERNPVRAGITEKTQEWRWSSSWRRTYGDAKCRLLLSDWPVPYPVDWNEYASRPICRTELEALRRSVSRGEPYGEEDWKKKTIDRLGLEWTIRSRGRPRKNKSKPKKDSRPLFSTGRP